MYSAMEPDASYLDLSGFLIKMDTNKECDELNTPIIEEKKNEFDFTSSSDVLVPMTDESDIWGIDSPFNESAGLISPNMKMESKYLDESTFLSPKNEENDIIVHQLVEGINPDFNVSNESLTLHSNAYFTPDNITSNLVTNNELVDSLEGKISNNDNNNTHFNKITHDDDDDDVVDDNDNDVDDHALIRANEKKLKLNLSLAPPQLETTVLSTPDVVQQILNHETNFDLLSYVFEDEKTSSNKHRSLMHTSKTNKRATFFKNSKLSNNNNSVAVVKSSKSTTTHSSPLITLDDSFTMISSSKNMKKIKVEASCEEIQEQQPTSSKNSSLCKKQVTPSITTVKPAARRGRPPGRRNNPPPKREASSFSNSDDDSDWVLKPSSSSSVIPNKRKRTISIVSTDSNQSSHSTALCSKYRELRDRNNEASRKSRMNRKAREEEMNEKLLLLEKENLKLRVKAEELERLVQEMRNALISAFKKK